MHWLSASHFLVLIIQYYIHLWWYCLPNWCWGYPTWASSTGSSFWMILNKSSSHAKVLTALPSPRGPGGSRCGQSLNVGDDAYPTHPYSLHTSNRKPISTNFFISQQSRSNSHLNEVCWCKDYSFWPQVGVETEWTCAISSHFVWSELPLVTGEREWGSPRYIPTDLECRMNVRV